MTHPAVHPPIHVHDGGPGTAAPSGRRRRWRGPAAITAAGLPLGLLWWLLAPAGLNLLTRDASLASGTNPETWLPRDLVLAGLFLLAGCVTGVLVAGNRPARLGAAAVFLAVAAAGAGALLAWGTGVLAGGWWGAAEDTSPSASIAFSLRAYPVLLIWPAATALALFLATAFTGSEPEGAAAGAGPSTAA